MKEKVADSDMSTLSTRKKKILLASVIAISIITGAVAAQSLLKIGQVNTSFQVSASFVTSAAAILPLDTAVPSSGSSLPGGTTYCTNTNSTTWGCSSPLQFYPMDYYWTFVQTQWNQPSGSHSASAYLSDSGYPGLSIASTEYAPVVSSACVFSSMQSGLPSPLAVGQTYCLFFELQASGSAQPQTSTPLAVVIQST